VNRAELLAVMRGNRYAIEATVTPTGAPQAAVIGVAVTDAFEMSSTRSEDSRKAQNLRVNRRWLSCSETPTNGDERTIQYEGLADEPAGRSCSV
jgi:hypothetical protein